MIAQKRALSADCGMEETHFGPLRETHVAEDDKEQVIDRRGRRGIGMGIGIGIGIGRRVHRRHTSLWPRILMAESQG